MSDVKQLLQDRNRHLNSILNAVLRGDVVDILNQAQDRGEDLLDIDTALMEAKRNGVDISGYLRHESHEGVPMIQTVDAHVAEITALMQQNGWKTSPTAKDRERVEKLLNAKAPKTPEGSASSMVAVTMNMEKLYARGLILAQKGHLDLAQKFFEKIALHFDVTPLDKSLWLGEGVGVDVDMSDVFDMDADKKLEAFNALLVTARTLLSRKMEGEDEENLRQEAFVNLISLLGAPALQAANLNGEDS